MLRSRALKAMVDGCGGGDDEMRPEQRHSGVAIGGGEDEAKTGLATVMPKIVGLNEGVFRTIVSFL